MAQESPKFLPTNISAPYDGVGGMPPVQNGWWTCPQCGSLVPHGSAHQCSHSVVAAAAVKRADPCAVALKRFAAALERTATALEAD